MKNKPVKHKTENTFRFQTFSERLSNVNVDVIHKVGLHKSTPFEAETFVQEAVNKWAELNCTEDFDSLKKEVGAEVETLPQLVLRKDAVIEALQNQLAKKDNKALDAVLEMVVALARDLQHYFYPSFPEFFRLICGHLNTQDTEILERIFMCLACLYKFLWRYMIKDIDQIFRLYIPLLSDQQKDYVRAFAAESFAFIMRKVPDKQELLSLIFGHLETNPKYTDGIGNLFFEMLKGVKGRLHSCAEMVLPLLLQEGLNGSMGCADLNRQALHITFMGLAAHVGNKDARDTTVVVWKSLQQAVGNIVATLDTNEAENKKAMHLENVLCLLNVWVTYKSGVLINDPEAVAQTLLPIVCLPEFTPSWTEKLLETVCQFLETQSRFLSPETTDQFVTQLYNGSYATSSVFSFSQCAVDLPMFEKSVLPRLLVYCSKLEAKPDAIALLAEVMLRRNPIPLSGDELKHWSPLYLDAASSLVKTPADQQEAVSILANDVASFLSRDIGDPPSLPLLWAALSCLPHFRALRTAEVKESVSMLITSLCQCLNSETEHQSVYSFLLFQTVVTSVLCGLTEVLALVTCKSFIELLRIYPQDLHLLRSTECYLAYLSRTDERETLTVDLLQEMYQVLESSLASPYSLVRQACLGIFFYFDLPLPSIEDDAVVQIPVFETCLKAEKVPNTVQHYRERLKLLQGLSADAVKMCIPIGPFEMAPVRYLLGTLFINFSLLWKPVQEILATHAGTDDKFWLLLFEHLRLVNATILDYKPPQELVFELPDCDGESPVIQAFSEALQTTSDLKEKPDYVNHRHLLWKAVEQTRTAERRNKDIVALFYSFLEKEFWPNTIVAPYHNVQRAENDHELPEEPEAAAPLVPNDPSVILLEPENADDVDDGAAAAADDDDDDDEMDGSGVDDEVEQEPRDKRGRRSFPDLIENEGPSTLAPRARCRLTRSLCDHLGVFAKFVNPKAISHSQELHQLYLDLLTFRETDVQKLAFDCLLTYKHKFLEPYKENFQKLLDDKTFKSEIVLFSVDSESGVVQEDHRKELLPVLMRVLHGKMHSRSGSKTGGKHRFVNKQSIVLRFLASCKEEEIRSFIDLELAALKDYQQSESLLEMVQKIRTLLDVTKIIPIRRLHGMLTTVETMLKYLGGLVPNLVPLLLRLIVAAVVYADTLLCNKDKVVRSILGTTRVLRSQGIRLLGWFFLKFDRYGFTSDEIDAIFEAAVWPLLPVLESGNKHKPSPLLRFFANISRNPRYFVLFSKHKSTDPIQSPLPPIISLLNNVHLSSGVLRVLLSIVHNLLSLEEKAECDDENALPPPPPLQVANCHTLRSADQDGATLGRMLLLPYVPHIIKRLKLVLESAIKTKRAVSAVEMGILTVISKDVTSPSQCLELARLFIAGFKKLKSTAHDAEQQKLSTILNLMKCAESPEEVVGRLSSYFSTLSNRQSRQLLCDIYSAVASKVPQYRQLATFIRKVNAWHPRYAEEPNYESRLDGFKLGVTMIEGCQDPPDTAVVLPVIYNCTYAMRTASDLALRDSASHALCQIMPIFATWLNEHKEVYRICISEALTSEIKKGLCCKTEANRHEFVNAFSLLLQHCGEHPSLAGLKKLCNTDSDMDFWVNICHIQLHRRCRALNRLSSQLRSGELQLNQKGLTDVVLPLASSFLFSESYAKHAGLVEAAIETLSAVSEHLPWRGYEHLLWRYLRLLQRDVEHHNTVVRIVVGILNSFHFNLSKSRGFGKDVQPKPAVLDEEMLEEEADDSDGEDTDAGKEAVPAPDDGALDEDAATSIHTTIAVKLLPHLHKALTNKAKSDDEHKVVRSGHPEDSEVLRIPIAVAIVKLLQQLPHGMLQRHLPGVLLKICQFLRSRLMSIRDSARETLLKIMSSLGPAYFGYLLQQMRGTLQRGYQVHVMMYTAHAVLESLTPVMKPGDLDSCFTDVIEVCQNELFTDLSEEKEVTQITGKVKEARSTKSYNIYKILAMMTTEETLPRLTAPLKSVTLMSVSHKVVKKCEDCFHRIVSGLAANSALPVEKLLIYSYSMIKENLDDLHAIPKVKKPVSEPRLLEERSDVFLLPQEPSRDGLPVTTSRRTNTHVLVEFGLKILHSLFKQSKLDSSEKKHLEMLDPFVPLLTSLVDSSHVKVVTISLRCFVRLLQMELPALKDNMPQLARSLFVILHKYAGAGMKQGENFELVVLSFKVMTILVREPDMYKTEENQLIVLLGYVETDLYDHTRQSTAFALLKAILAHKLDKPQLHELMEKIAQMSISDEKEHVRSKCREVYLHYVLDYPMKHRMRKAVGFFVAQLGYGVESGRASALEMINAYSAHFPPATLEHYAGTLFVAMAARLVNDDSPNMRRMASAAVKSLLGKLSDNSRSSLFAIVVSWMKAKMFAMLRLAAQVIGVFAEIEKEKFERFLPDLLPLLVAHLNPEKFEEFVAEDIEKTKDHIAYQLLVSLAKIVLACNVIRNPTYYEQTGKILEYTTSLLLHPHVWVRLAASQLFGAVFTSYDVEEIVSACQSEPDTQDYLLKDCAKKIRDLTEKFCHLLRTGDIVAELAEQAVKNLVFTTKISWRFMQNSCDSGKGDVHTLDWILKRAEQQARQEVSTGTGAVLKRSNVFKFMAAVALDLSKEELLKHLHIILRPICRELEDKSPHQDESLKNLAQEVTAVLKKAAGVEAFTNTLVKLQGELSSRKLKRKRERALEAVVNPELGAKRKIKRQLAKRVSQKRKLAVKHGKKVKKRKV
ncbi:small subunit processome component 20 homolog [Ornithodoros turicata]|uniref:small subunit processome component 20 homolog n=1 Tax=Ornithodoros turicata TaxID=34597 RepID=UPI003139F6B7